MTVAEVMVAVDLLGEDDTEGALTVWLVENGDRVSKGDVLCEVMVEKAAIEIVSPAEGRITLLLQPESAVKKGDVIARISTG